MVWKPEPILQLELKIGDSFLRFLRLAEVGRMKLGFGVVVKNMGTSVLQIEDEKLVKAN